MASVPTRISTPMPRQVWGSAFSKCISSHRRPERCVMAYGTCVFKRAVVVEEKRGVWGKRGECEGHEFVLQRVARTNAVLTPG